MAQMFYKDAAGVLIPLANAGPRITVSSTAPSTPANGDLWVDLSAMSWTAPTFQNSWVNYGDQWNVAGYCKDPSGIVRLRGLIKNGSAGTIFTLPVGFRPSATCLYLVACNHATPPGNARIDVLSNGSVNLMTYATGGNNAWVSLDGITFATF